MGGIVEYSFSVFIICEGQFEVDVSGSSILFTSMNSSDTSSNDWIDVGTKRKHDCFVFPDDN